MKSPTSMEDSVQSRFASSAKRVALLMPTTTYRADDFLAAADGLGAEVVLGTDRCHVLDALGAVPTARDSLVLDFRDPRATVEKLAAYHAEKPLAAVIATDDVTAPLAAEASKAIGLPNNPPKSAAVARDKLWLRVLLSRAGLPGPKYRSVRRPRWNGVFPVVLKPRFLSMSRGVIRADDQESFIAAFVRISKLIGSPEMRARGGRAARSILVEEFIPGVEVALEGLVNDGVLEVLAIFDKPDPLDGPFFEETLYVTPSRLSMDREITAAVQQAIRAIGLTFGPVHAELRINDRGIYVLEVAPRAIGGLCARTLRFGLGVSLETLIVAQAIGVSASHHRDARASGVMMLPIPRTGTLRSIGGVEEAKRVALIEDVVITAPIGHEVVALPEGNAYLGFIFARGDAPDAVERALREATARLEIEVSPKIQIMLT